MGVGAGFGVPQVCPALKASKHNSHSRAVSGVSMERAPPLPPVQLSPVQSPPPPPPPPLPPVAEPSPEALPPLPPAGGERGQMWMGGLLLPATSRHCPAKPRHALAMLSAPRLTASSVASRAAITNASAATTTCSEI